MNDKQTHTIQLNGPYLDILSLRQSGLCCSQIMVKLVLRDLGRDNPDLVRAMAPLCFGSYTGGVCGVLTGAACALSLYLGTNPDREQQDPLLPLLLCELSDWFTVETERSYGGSRCAEILTASPDKRVCILLMISTLEKLQSMMATVGNVEKGRNHGHS
jgi:putative redox-active protein with C_GCAxxG_C_C motif